MKNSIFLMAVFLCVPASGKGYKPPSGFVPDSKTAVKIAETVLMPVYGEKQIESERPFLATLKEKIWTVAGTLRCPNVNGGTTNSCDGGTAEVQIAKDDGRIFSMIHHK
jgi:hypothetical protein